MPALNFQARFAPAVESGENRQTIRAYRKDGRDPKPGDTLYLYTDMRTKACRKLGEARCRVATRFWLSQVGPGGNVNLSMGEPYRESGETKFRLGSSKERSRRRFVSVAKRDGFSSVDEMIDWFERTHGLPFEGLLIRW